MPPCSDERRRACGAQAYDGARTSAVPEDLAAAMEAGPKAKAFFATIDAANRYAVLWRIRTAGRATAPGALPRCFTPGVTDGLGPSFGISPASRDGRRAWWRRRGESATAADGQARQTGASEAVIRAA